MSASTSISECWLVRVKIQLALLSHPPAGTDHQSRFVSLLGWYKLRLEVPDHLVVGLHRHPFFPAPATRSSLEIRAVTTGRPDSLDPRGFEVFNVSELGGLVLYRPFADTHLPG